MITIRPARLADAPGIRAIRNTAVRESLALWTGQEHSPDQARTWLAPMVERGTALVAIAEAGGQGSSGIVGFAVASPWRDYEGYARTVEDSIYLAPTAQGQGVGGRLLAALIDASRAAGDRTMIAAIEAGNTASIHLHERHGFTLVGTIPQAGEKLGQILDLALLSRPLV